MNNKNFYFRYGISASLLSEASIDIDNLLEKQRENMDAMRDVGTLLQDFVRQCQNPDEFMTNDVMVMDMIRRPFFEAIIKSLKISTITDLDSLKDPENLQHLLARIFMIADRLTKGNPTSQEGDFCLNLCEEMLNLDREISWRHQLVG